MDIKIGRLAERSFIFDPRASVPIKPEKKRETAGKGEATIDGIVTNVNEMSIGEPSKEDDADEEDLVEDEEDEDETYAQAPSDAIPIPQLEPDQATQYTIISDEQPIEWTPSRFVVVDPFIRNKV